MKLQNVFQVMISSKAQEYLATDSLHHLNIAAAVRISVRIRRGIEK